MLLILYYFYISLNNFLLKINKYNNFKSENFYKYLYLYNYIYNK